MEGGQQRSFEQRRWTPVANRPTQVYEQSTAWLTARAGFGWTTFPWYAKKNPACIAFTLHSAFCNALFLGVGKTRTALGRELTHRSRVQGALDRYDQLA